MLVRPILVEVLKRDRYRRLRSGGRRDSGVDVSDLLMGTFVSKRPPCPASGRDYEKYFVAVVAPEAPRAFGVKSISKRR